MSYQKILEVGDQFVYNEKPDDPVIVIIKDGLAFLSHTPYKTYKDRSAYSVKAKKHWYVRKSAEEVSEAFFLQALFLGNTNF